MCRILASSVFLLLIFVSVKPADGSEVLVTLHQIKRGESITEHDVAIKQSPRSDDDKYLSSTNELPVVARRNLQKGSYIRRNDIETNNASLVHKGDVVTVKFLRSNLSIEMQCVALSGGKSNDVIRVKNPDSNKILTAKIQHDGSLIIIQ